MSTNQPTVCRCEMIGREAIEEAIAEGNQTINDIKRRTRAGMGICQGIFCTAAIAGVLIEHGVDPADIEPMTARPPMRLVDLSVAASSVLAEE